MEKNKAFNIKNKEQNKYKATDINIGKIIK